MNRDDLIMGTILSLEGEKEVDDSLQKKPREPSVQYLDRRDIKETDHHRSYLAPTRHAGREASVTKKGATRAKH